MTSLIILIGLLLSFAIIIALYIESHSPKNVKIKLTDDPKILFEDKEIHDIEIL